MEIEQKNVLSNLNTNDAEFVYAASKSIQTFKPDAIFENLATPVEELEVESEEEGSSSDEEGGMGVEYRKGTITAMAPIKVSSFSFGFPNHFIYLRPLGYQKISEPSFPLLHSFSVV
jgi:hypothetical protein